MRKMKKAVIYEVLATLIFIFVFLVAYAVFTPIIQKFIEFLAECNADQAAKAAKVWSILPSLLITVIIIWAIVSTQRKQPQYYG